MVLKLLVKIATKSMRWLNSTVVFADGAPESAALAVEMVRVLIHVVTELPMDPTDLKLKLSREVASASIAWSIEGNRCADRWCTFLRGRTPRIRS